MEPRCHSDKRGGFGECYRFSSAAYTQTARVFFENENVALITVSMSKRFCLNQTGTIK